MSPHILLIKLIVRIISRDLIEILTRDLIEILTRDLVDKRVGTVNYSLVLNGSSHFSSSH